MKASVFFRSEDDFSLSVIVKVVLTFLLVPNRNPTILSGVLS